MNSEFGKTLRNLMQVHDIKEQELANALSYDTTYISKWINGNKLPSSRNVERIVAQIAEFLWEHSVQNNVEHEDGAEHVTQMQSMLQEAYDHDRSEQEFQTNINATMSFTQDRQFVSELIMQALKRSLLRHEGNLHVVASYDIFKEQDDLLRILLESYSRDKVQSIHLTQSISGVDLQENYYFYAKEILNLIGNYGNIDLLINQKESELPRILCIDDVMVLQFLWNIDGQIGVAYSMDPETIQSFQKICAKVTLMTTNILTSAESTSLLKTNTQLDSYSNKRQRLFFNEAPALLFPDSIMDDFIASSQDEAYTNYLTKLKKVFQYRTKKSRLDLVLYASMMNDYITDGKLTLGSVPHTLTQEQVREHIEYLNQLLTENENIRIFLIRDNVVGDPELKKSPSLFVDEHGIYIENSGLDNDNNFHISMTPIIRDTFDRFFDDLLEKPYCHELQEDDLLIYI